MRLSGRRLSTRWFAWFAGGLCVSVATLGWLGILVSQEWQRSSVQLVQRRADEAARVLVTAVTRDMRAVETNVLGSRVWDDFSPDAPDEIEGLVATAFARYPYPEAFFAWRAGDPPGRVVFFARTNRWPGWLDTSTATSRYPVQTASSPEVARTLVARLARDTVEGRTLSVAEPEVGGTPYSVVAHVRYRDRLNQTPVVAFGFLVNQRWARQRYFGDLLGQVARVGGGDVGLAVGLIDDEGALVASTNGFVPREASARGAFPLLFFDPREIAAAPPPDLRRRSWTIVTSGAADPILADAIRSARWTLTVATLASVVLAIGLLLGARADAASTMLAETRSEFMSSVTHELRTPLASIRALGETLQSGRVADVNAYREYGALIAHEGKRLSRLVDNVLAHARMTDQADFYAFECLDVADLVRAATAAFKFQVDGAGFMFDVRVPDNLPMVMADQLAAELVLDNLIDNAIRYSGTSRQVGIVARAVADGVAIGITDHGIGIPPEDRGRITQRFVRGRNAVPGGSGLGLAIVKRIVGDHKGTLAIASEVGRGTTVTVTFPRAPERAEEVLAADASRVELGVQESA